MTYINDFQYIQADLVSFLKVKTCNISFTAIKHHHKTSSLFSCVFFKNAITASFHFSSFFNEVIFLLVYLISTCNGV